MVFEPLVALAKKQQSDRLVHPKEPGQMKGKSRNFRPVQLHFGAINIPVRILGCPNTPTEFLSWATYSQDLLPLYLMFYGAENKPACFVSPSLWDSAAALYRASLSFSSLQPSAQSCATFLGVHSPQETITDYISCIFKSTQPPPRLFFTKAAGELIHSICCSLHGAYAF